MLVALMEVHPAVTTQSPSARPALCLLWLQMVGIRLSPETHKAVRPYDTINSGNSFSSPLRCHSWRVRAVCSFFITISPGSFFSTAQARFMRHISVFELLWPFRKLQVSCEHSLKPALKSKSLPLLSSLSGIWTWDTVSQPGVQH